MAFEVVYSTTQTLAANDTLVLGDAADGDLVIFYGVWWDGDQFWAQALSLDNCTTELISNFNDQSTVVRLSNISGVVSFTPIGGEYAFFSLALYRDAAQAMTLYDQAGYNPIGPVWFEPARFTEYHAVLVHGSNTSPDISGPAGLHQLTHGTHTDGAFTEDLSIWEFPVLGSPIPEIYVSGVGYLILLSQPFPVLPADPDNPAPVGSGQLPIN